MNKDGRLEWYDNPAYKLTRRTDTAIILILFIAYIILMTIWKFTIQSALILLLANGIVASLVRLGGLHRTPIRVGLSSKGLYFTRGVLKKTSFVKWSSVESIRLARVFPSFVEPKHQIALILEMSGRRFLNAPNEIGISVVKDLADKIVATSGKPVKKGRFRS